jgi:hypothetical protein
MGMWRIYSNPDPHGSSRIVVNTSNEILHKYLIDRLSILLGFFFCPGDNISIILKHPHFTIIDGGLQILTTDVCETLMPLGHTL